jgi:hypothetical protein
MKIRDRGKARNVMKYCGQWWWVLCSTFRPIYLGVKKPQLGTSVIIHLAPTVKYHSRKKATSSLMGLDITQSHAADVLCPVSFPQSVIHRWTDGPRKFVRDMKVLVCIMGSSFASLLLLLHLCLIIHYHYFTYFSSPVFLVVHYYFYFPYFFYSFYLPFYSPLLLLFSLFLLLLLPSLLQSVITSIFFISSLPSTFPSTVRYYFYFPYFFYSFYLPFYSPLLLLFSLFLLFFLPSLLQSVITSIFFVPSMPSNFPSTLIVLLFYRNDISAVGTSYHKWNNQLRVQSVISPLLPSLTPSTN